MFDDGERARYEDDGFVVRRAVFAADEVAAIVEACEALVADLVRDRQGIRLRAGSYVFDPDLVRLTMIKWEGDTDVVHGIEPLAHLSDPLRAWAEDRRFLEPMGDAIGVEDPILFTEKLNLKRPRVGGVNPLHQDEPYWRDSADDPDRVATAMLFLDDANIANGCLEVVPASHRQGRWTTRTDGDRFAGNEIDAGRYPDVEPVPIEAAPGDVVFFGPYLVHRSAPNTSGTERRALLFSYQPAGARHMTDNLKLFTTGGPTRGRR